MIFHSVLDRVLRHNPYSVAMIGNPPETFEGNSIDDGKGRHLFKKLGELRLFVRYQEQLVPLGKSV